MMLTLVALTAGCGEKAQRKEVPKAQGEEDSKAQVGVNLLKNPSFEEWAGNHPLHWNLTPFESGGTRTVRYGRSTDEKVSGNYSFYLEGRALIDRWMVLVQRVPVLPRYRLRYGGQMRGKDLQKDKGQEDRANLYVRFLDKDGKRLEEKAFADVVTRVLRGTTPWQRYGREVEVPENAAFAEFGLICLKSGTIYFDDIEAVLDEPIPWQEIEKKYVKYYYLEGNPFPRGAVDRQDEFVAKCVKMLDIDVKDKVKYYYYPSNEKYQEISGRKSGHGRAVWSKQELHTTKPYDHHEIVHMLLVPFGYPPFGLCEGVVFYVLGSWEDGRNLHMMAKDLLMNRRLPPLREALNREDMKKVGGLGNTVPGWASFTIWIVDRHGIEKLMELYKATNEATDYAAFNEKFKKVYGQEFEAADQEWRLWVLRYQPK